MPHFSFIHPFQIFRLLKSLPGRDLGRLLSFLFFFFSVSSSYSQELSGTWEGSVRNSSYLKIHLEQNGDTCFGYKLNNGSRSIILQGHYDEYEGTLTGKAANLTEQSYEDDIVIFNLQYSTSDEHEYLIGVIARDGTDETVMNLTGAPVFLEKIKGTAAPRKKKVLFQHKKDTVQKTVAVKLSEDSVTKLKQSRSTKILRTISVKADSVKIILKDDGEVDGDVVTVFDNGKILVRNLSLSLTPYEITLYLSSDGPGHTLELVAENEGEVPPNTAYMLVIAGNERVEVKTSSDKMSNAAVIIQKEK